MAGKWKEQAAAFLRDLPAAWRAAGDVQRNAYASHGGGAHLHVLAALPNTLFMESGLNQGQLVDGCYLLPQEPGLGTVHH